MAALRSRCAHHIFPVSIFLFSSPNLSGRRLDIYHTTHANLEYRSESEMCCTRLAGNAGPKISPKIKIHFLGTMS